MAERGRGGRGRRGGRNTFLNSLALDMNTTPAMLRKANLGYQPEPTFPDFLVPRPSKLQQDETNIVKYYKNLRSRILEDTPFYITVRKRPADDDEDDGRDKYKPAKSHRQTLRGFPTDESFFPDELKSVLQGDGTTAAKKQLRKYNLDDFLEVGNDEDILDQAEDEGPGPTKTDIIRNEEDDEIEPVGGDSDADEDLEEDDYGEDYFDNGEGDFDEYVEMGDDD